MPGFPLAMLRALAHRDDKLLKGGKVDINRLIRDEKGYALAVAIILLLISGLIIGPLLSFMGTGLIVGEVHERRTAELYAADAGVTDAAWRIHNDRTGLPAPSCANPNPSTSYNITDVNRRNVRVTIQYIDARTYRVTSNATTGNKSSTQIEAIIHDGELCIFRSALASKHDIGFWRRTEVAGDIRVGGRIDGRENLNQTSGRVINVTSADFPTPAQVEAFATRLQARAKAGTTHLGDMTITHNRSLGPIYITGDLRISGGVTVDITGIVFIRGSIDAWEPVTLRGSGSIIAGDDIGRGRISRFGPGVNCSITMIMSLRGDIEFGANVTINSLIYAPGGAIAFGERTVVNGGVVGQSLGVGGLGSFTFVRRPRDFDLPGQANLTIISYRISASTNSR